VGWRIRKISLERVSDGGQYPRTVAAHYANDPGARELAPPNPEIIDYVGSPT
jgi:hypothetical protein